MLIFVAYRFLNLSWAGLSALLNKLLGADLKFVRQRSIAFDTAFYEFGLFLVLFNLVIDSGLLRGSSTMCVYDFICFVISQHLFNIFPCLLIRDVFHKLVHIGFAPFFQPFVHRIRACIICGYGKRQFALKSCNKRF